MATKMMPHQQCQRLTYNLGYEWIEKEKKKTEKSQKYMENHKSYVVIPTNSYSLLCFLH